jgi:hypothetical protein
MIGPSASTLKGFKSAVVHRTTRYLPVLVIVAFVAVGLLLYTRFHATSMVDPLRRTDTTMIGKLDGHVGVVDDFIYDVSNASVHNVLLDRLAFASGTGQRLAFKYSGVVQGQDFFASSGWPPRLYGSRRTYPVVPLRGYVVPPGGHASVVAGFIARSPGTYEIGPIIVIGNVEGHRSMLPFIDGSDFTTTLPQYAFLCVAVSKRACESNEQRARAHL